jgi:hypothetical protein
MGIKKSRKPVQFTKELTHQNNVVSTETAGQSATEITTPCATVIPLPISEPYLLHSTNNDGAAILTAIFPSVSVKGAPLRINLSYLLKVPYLTEPLGEYYLKSQENVTLPETARTQASRLGTGFVAFLSQTGRTHMRLSDINVTVANAYVEWLERADSQGLVLAVQSRVKYYAVLKNIVRTLRHSPTWSQYIAAILELPAPPWAGTSNRNKPTSVINAEAMTLIRLKCIDLVKETVTRFYENKQIVENNALPPLTSKRGNKLTQEEFLAAINHHCSAGPIMATQKLPAILASTAKRIGLSNIRNDVGPRFHAVTTSLVPFVILMTVATAYNTETILNALLSDFRFENDFGNWFVADAFKGRSGTSQPVYIPIDDEYDNPAFLYTFLVEYTARVREFSHPDVRNKLFIGSSRMNMSTVIDINNSLWNSLLREFIKVHGLPNFRLKSIRPTVLDVTADMYSGDIKAVQIQANHKSSQTTYTHYTSDARRQKDYERLGRTLQRKDRWRETRGIIDSRDRGDEEDLDCATPGWQCADPFDSPFSPKGKLCNSYGHCPRCPLGGIDLNSPLAFAFTMALREAVNSAQQSMAPETWLKKMGAVKVAIEQKWLPSFTPYAIEAARSLQIPKLPIPE